MNVNDAPHIVIACGGTGGHLYPGLAIAERLVDEGATVTLIVSPKEVDRRVLNCEQRFRVITLPAIGFSVRGLLRFMAQSWKSYRMARADFRANPPDLLLSMGGFTSAAPAWAARDVGALVLLHEANAIPGRANRWLARFTHRAYVFFPEAVERLRPCEVQMAGMPVREAFQPGDPAVCRSALGLAPDRPVLLVMGGSQGASGINERMAACAPLLARRLPDLQVLHLAGSRDDASVRKAYQAANVRAVVRPFLTEMELALGAADAAVSRAGASSLAELAAMGVPPLLIPYPYAADNHQLANARAFESTDAARVLTQSEATPERLADEIVALLTDTSLRDRLKAGISSWHWPDADRTIAAELMEFVRARTNRARNGVAAAAPG